MKCVCGLNFMKVDWLHHRKRGYCSYKCRKKDVLKRYENR
jgi:hypothetical protein